MHRAADSFQLVSVALVPAEEEEGHMLVNWLVFIIVVVVVVVSPLGFVLCLEHCATSTFFLFRLMIDIDLYTWSTINHGSV